MSTAAGTGSMQSLEQSIGARLKITVNYQPEPIEGVLVAVDPATQTLVLRRLLLYTHTHTHALPSLFRSHQSTHTHRGQRDDRDDREPRLLRGGGRVCDGHRVAEHRGAQHGAAAARRLGRRGPPRGGGARQAAGARGPPRRRRHARAAGALRRARARVPRQPLGHRRRDAHRGRRHPPAVHAQ